jgi:S-DNA-T family DNA segregation ATPase FtsK/SpoIIIE
MSLQPLIGTRVELRLNDPADSLIDRRLMRTVRADQPGRALTEARLFAQVALPVLEDVPDAELGTALSALAQRTAAGWSGPSAAPIRLLPAVLDPATLPDPFDEPDVVPIGLRQDTMRPVALDLQHTDQHLSVFGDAGCGKTTLLRGVITGLTDRYTPDELVIAVLDSRGGLRDACPDAYLGGYASSSTEARALSTAIAEELAKRRETRATAPRIVVIADDLDILASGGADPLGPLLPFLPQARDLALHVIVTRPVAGLQRALFDRTLQTIRDTGGTTLLMSGERAEGQIQPQVYAEPMVAGRGRLLRRGERAVVVQVADFRPSLVGADGTSRP